MDVELTPAKRRQLSSRAVRFYTDDEIEWVQSYWAIGLDDGEPSDEAQLTNPGESTLGTVRNWLRNFGFGARNKRCGVCAEGALVLAFAEDESLPDDIAVGELLGQFNDDAGRVATANSWNWEGRIYTLNDSFLRNQDQVVKLLRGMSETAE